MYPEADVPVVQLSIDQNLAPAEHHRLGQRLAPLREQGVLIMGSGNVVHNLRDAFGRMRSGDLETPAWARQFDDAVRLALAQHDTRQLIDLWPHSASGRQAHPTPDHWLPLIYAAATIHSHDQVVFPIEGFDAGSLSMRSVLWRTSS